MWTFLDRGMRTEPWWSPTDQTANCAWKALAFGKPLHVWGASAFWTCLNNDRCKWIEIHILLFASFCPDMDLNVKSRSLLDRPRILIKSKHTLFTICSWMGRNVLTLKSNNNKETMISHRMKQNEKTQQFVTPLPLFLPGSVMHWVATGRLHIKPAQRMLAPLQSQYCTVDDRTAETSSDENG